MGKRVIRLACLVIAGSVGALVAAAASADVKLSVPAAILKFDAGTGDLTANSQVLWSVTLDNNGTTSSLPASQFQLSTSGMTPVATADPNVSRIWAATSSNPGTIALLDSQTSSTVLTGQLMGLSLDVANPASGLIEGAGSFAVTGGSLAGDFGSDGVLETVALSFALPVGFSSDFTVFANSVLASTSPSGDSGAVPEASAFVVWLGLIGVMAVGTSVFARRKASDAS